MSEFDADFEEDSNDGLVHPHGSQPNQPLSTYKCKELLYEKLQSSGQKDLLKRMIQNRLSETGVTYRLRQEFIEYIKRRGPNNVNVSHMIEDVHPIGKTMVPEDLKNELRAFLMDFAKTYVEVDEIVPRPTEAEVAFSNRSLTFNYQSRDVIPDPGIGVGLGTSSTDNNSSGSSVASGSGGSTYSSSAVSEDGGSPRSCSLTPPPSEIPFLLPENILVGSVEESGSEEERETEEEDIEGEGEEEEEDTERGDDENEGIEGYGEVEDTEVDREYVHSDRTDFKVAFAEGDFYGDGEEVMVGEMKIGEDGYEVLQGVPANFVYGSHPTDNDDEDEGDFILSTV